MWGESQSNNGNQAVSEGDNKVKDVGIFLTGLIEAAYGSARVSYEKMVMSITYNGESVTKVFPSEDNNVKIEGPPLDEGAIIHNLFEGLVGFCVSYNAGLETIITSGFLQKKNQ